jgi:glutathione synthase/RimK-type ligase-like ATP-grasp enzyme
MKRIGVLYGMEETFPPALVNRINGMNVEGVIAEPLKVGAVTMAEPSGYRVIVDRISQDIPFYRAFLKNAVLGGAVVLNNPFWWTADDKFFNFALMAKAGVAIPPTVLLPHHDHPPNTSDRSMRNLIFPIDWQQVFGYIGFPAFLKPYDGGGWRDVYKVNNPDEFFDAYAKSGQLCMTLQRGVNFEDYFRCYCIGREKVHIMRYDPRRPHHERYVLDGAPIAETLRERVTRDCITICQALGYDINTIEFAVEGGVPYAIDFLNPAPDADVHSVGPDNFAWIIDAVAELAVKKALSEERPQSGYLWSNFLNG